jgi:hypothetical protein
VRPRKSIEPREKAPICGAIKGFFFQDFSTIVVARVEQNIAWPSSLVNYFEQKASAGTTLAFASDLSVRAVTSKNVYVTGVNFTAENVGTQDIRNSTLNLQEA